MFGKVYNLIHLRMHDNFDKGLRKEGCVAIRCLGSVGFA